MPSSYDAPPPPPVHRHPSSAYSQQTQRQYDGQQQSLPRQNTIPRRPLSQSPPPHYGVGAVPNTSQPSRQSDTTPGMDNLSTAAAGGGIAGIAMGVASTNERDSGVQALRDIDNLYRSGDIAGPRHTPLERRFDPDEDDHYGGFAPAAALPPRRPTDPQPSYSSTIPLAAASYAPAAASRAESSSERSIPLYNQPSPSAYPYADSPYDQYSSSNLRLAPAMGAIDPNSIADDGDDDFAHAQHGQKRRSLLPFGNNRNSSHEGVAPAAAGVGAGAAAAGAFAFGARDASGTYNAVPTNGIQDSASGGTGGIGPGAEKSDWLNRQNTGNKRLKWIVGTIVALVIIGAIVGGVIGGVLSRKNNKSSSKPSDQTPQGVANDNKSDLDKNSAEIQKLLGNTNLHKVFPGMDYTPLNAQYPDCMQSPPSQNNVTRDMAMLSQLTNAVRLYGTDCNQTEMVLHAIDRLELTDMKVWLGVWLGKNDTTNDRQLAQMWQILDDQKSKNNIDVFKGVIVGNEVLFREDLSIDTLGTILGDVKKNLTDREMDLPLATSDLGDNWTAALTLDVDIVMSNIHPFFAGVTAEAAAGWTWTFWQGKDVALTEGKSTKQIISEVGWPSAGGNDCGEADCTSDTQGSIAGIDEMNTFMENWVCQSLANSTEYFWFEAFDEPWKIQFDTKGKEWEDKWGLMDVDRNLKDGVKIPDCGGKTAA
ncbi:glycoside hydrolase [Lophium mytilinum]|uniref:glucan endo-1,3-beta-D-glucosidase n=1 Tax=Lophium mytilinum TaxID=390894 RepID=A0A6A6QLV1_9PEZI|nr:glycoside hydrolase [Lophium mytilinum]